MQCKCWIFIWIYIVTNFHIYKHVHKHKIQMYRFSGGLLLFFRLLCLVRNGLEWLKYLNVFAVIWYLLCTTRILYGPLSPSSNCTCLRYTPFLAHSIWILIGGFYWKKNKNENRKKMCNINSKIQNSTTAPTKSEARTQQICMFCIINVHVVRVHFICCYFLVKQHLLVFRSFSLLFLFFKFTKRLIFILLNSIFVYRM